MSDPSEIDVLIAAVAKGDPVDWDTARDRANSDADRAYIDALQGIVRIAAFGHDQWQQFRTLVERALEMDPASLEPWLDGLDEHDANDLRQILKQRQSLHQGSPLAGGESLAGQTVGPYILESLIGAGGMGAVWLARRSDGRFEGRAAVKLLHLPRVEPDGLLRFQREGQILARLRHPNIAQLMDAGMTTGGQPYLVLEHVDGVAIDRYCDLHGLDVRARVELFLDVLEAVAHAQANLVLHRDLKPSNILVDNSGHVKLLDFGIAKLLEGDSIAAPETELTQRAGHAFTPEFAAPEQLRGGAVTTAIDVYAAAVVLYLLLTGRHPTAAGHGTPLEKMQAILASSPRLASDVVEDDANASSRRRRELQGDLDNVLAKALKKVPEERYANAATFAEDLRRYLKQEPVLARPDTITYRIGKFVRRNRLAVASASLAIIALLGSTGVAISQLFEARRQRDEARRQQEEARQQTQRAEAFNTVVTSLLSQTGPGGRALTQEELLDHAVDEMEARYANDPAFLVDMLIRISGRYLDIGNTNKEYATLVRAEQTARRTNDPALIFDTQINTVETELNQGRIPEARKRIEEARSLLPQMKQPPQTMIPYLRAEAQLAEADGDLPAAIVYLERARHDLESRDGIHDNAYVGILSLLRLYNTLTGNVRQAHEYALEWVDVEESHRRLGTASGVNARLVLATSVYSLGEVRRARGMFEAIDPEFKEIGAGKIPTTPSPSWWGYGDLLSRLGHHDAAIAAVRGVVQAAHENGWQLLEIKARVILSRTLLRAGRMEELHRELDDVVRIMLADEAANQPLLIEANRIRSEAHLTEKQVETAAGEVIEALRRLGYPEKRRGPGLPQVLVTLARVQRAQGRPSEALESARAAVQLSEQDTIDPEQSADVGESLLELARAQLEVHDDAAARTSLARAVQSLRNGLGPAHALTLESEQLAGSSVSTASH